MVKERPILDGRVLFDDLDGVGDDDEKKVLF